MCVTTTASEGMSIFAQQSHLLRQVRGADGAIQTAAFLDICRAVVQVLEKMGKTFHPVKADIKGNIDRLQRAHDRDPANYVQLTAIIEDDVAYGTHTSSSSDTKGLLWLKRGMGFVLGVLQRMVERPQASLKEVVGETYSATLHQYHNWLTQRAFGVAFNFVPSRESLLKALGGGATLEAEISAFLAEFTPVLSQVHEFLVQKGLDDPQKV